jgi:6-phosphogluconolactonase
VVTQLRSHPTTRLRLALLCAAGIAVVGSATAVASTGKQQAHRLAKSAAIGAVYTETNSPAGNAVVVFDRFADGTLAKRQSVATGGVGSTQDVGCGPGCPILDSQNAVVVSQDGHVVVAVNAGSDTVSSFRETGGGLVLVDQVSSGGDMPESLALHDDLLYVLNVATENPGGTTGNIYGLRVSQDGHLTPVGSSQPLPSASVPGHVADPRAIDFNPTGKVIVVTELSGGFMTGPPGTIDTFVVGHDGKAAPGVSHRSSDAFPFGFAFDNKGHLIVSQLHVPDNMTVGSVSTYDVSDSGDVTAIDTKSSEGVLPCWIATTNNGRYTYAVNTGAGFPATVKGFALSPKGQLTPLGPATGSGDFARTDATVSRDSRYLYVLSPQVAPPFGASHIDEYSIGNDGSLTLIGSTPAGANLGIGATGLAAR